MQRKVVLTLALVLCLASYAQATLTIVVGQHNYAQGTGVVTIPITVSSDGTDPVHSSDISVQLGGNGAAVAPTGSTPPITYQGAEEATDPDVLAPVLGRGGPGGPAPGNAAVMWDAKANTWGDSTVGSGPDTGLPTTPSAAAGYGTAGEEGTWFSGTIIFNATTTTNGQVNPNTTNGGLEVMLVVDLTGFGPGTWTLALLGAKAGPTDFINLGGNFIPTNIIDGAITIVPEPTSVVMGLFAAAGLGIVAVRKRRARRA